MKILNYFFLSNVRHIVFKLVDSVTLPNYFMQRSCQLKIIRAIIYFDITSVNMYITS